MSKRQLSFTAICITLLAACGGEPRAGQPETETTGSVQAVSQTSTAAATTTGASGGTLSDLPPETKEFVVNAGILGLAEVQMGNVALQRAANAEVKAFAQRMVTDHSASNAELAQLATLKGLALATELTGEPEDGLEHLSSLDGAAFDKAYMQHMVADHEKAVAEFDRASTSVADPAIKAFVMKNLPVLQQHLTAAKALARKV